MFCPECRAEYRPGFDRCAECDVDLVNELPAEPAAAGEHDLVELVRSTDIDELPVIKSALEAAGIPFIVQGEEFFGLMPVSSRLMGAIIRVPRDREAEAREVLEGATRPRDESPEE